MRSSMEEYLQSDLENNQVPGDAAIVESGEAIETVLDYRVGKRGATGAITKFWTVRAIGDPNTVNLETSETEEQFLIKWRGRSHLNNTWESQSSLEAMEELRSSMKLKNFQKKLAQQTNWRKTASPDEVEMQEVELQRDRQLRASYMEIHRIFGERIQEADRREYFVKWSNLNYEHATWEEESTIKDHYVQALSEYNARKENINSNPRNFRECITIVQTCFQPLRIQPGFIGSSSLRLRDYQLDGLNFLLAGWHERNSLILADEMVSLVTIS